MLERKWDTMPTLKWEMSKHWRMSSNEHMTERNTKLCDIFCNKKRDYTKIKVNSWSIFSENDPIFCSSLLVVEAHDWRIRIYNRKALQPEILSMEFAYNSQNLHIFFCNYHNKPRKQHNPPLILYISQFQASHKKNKPPFILRFHVN